MPQLPQGALGPLPSTPVIPSESASGGRTEGSLTGSPAPAQTLKPEPRPETRSAPSALPKQAGKPAAAPEPPQTKGPTAEVSRRRVMTPVIGLLAALLIMVALGFLVMWFRMDKLGMQLVGVSQTLTKNLDDIRTGLDKLVETDRRRVEEAAAVKKLMQESGTMMMETGGQMMKEGEKMMKEGEAMKAGEAGNETMMKKGEALMEAGQLKREDGQSLMKSGEAMLKAGSSTGTP